MGMMPLIGVLDHVSTILIAWGHHEQYGGLYTTTAVQESWHLAWE